MDSLGDEIRQWARSRGIALLAVPSILKEGFESVRVNRTSRLYGIHPDFDCPCLEKIKNGKQVRDAGLVSDDFPEEYLDRAIRIGKDRLIDSNAKGIDFYNGHLAKLTGFSINPGDSSTRKSLHLDVCDTSYFTALGTNIDLS